MAGIREEAPARLAGTSCQQVDVIVLSIDFHNVRLYFGADVGQDSAQVVDDFFGEHLTTVRRGK
ncbi:hypothetical protein ASL20_24235 [Cupriavidus necator]|nr:hypothetical protein ASL20_24235 [Cupriavidus necator]